MFEDLFEFIVAIVVAAFVIAYFRAWVRRRFWFPGYAHVLALFLYGIGYLGFRSFGSTRGLTLILVSLLFPLLGYVLFIAMGGVEAAAQRKGRGDI